MMKNSLMILLAAFVVPLYAEDMPQTNAPTGGTNAPPAAKSPGAAIPDATHKPVFTTNTVTIDGKRVKYSAETGMLPLLKSDGASRASVFYVAYTPLGETNETARPVTFCFNGGPGSSSFWLHLRARVPPPLLLHPA